MDAGDLIIRAVAFVVVVYVLWTAVRVLRWAWQKITGVSASGMARAAGAASAKVEQKAGELTSAFKAGRNQRTP